MYICIYIELPNYLGRPHPEGGVGVELEGEKIKDGTQNSTDTQRMPRKCGALLTALTGNLQAAGSVTLAGQGHGGTDCGGGMDPGIHLLQKSRDEGCEVEVFVSVMICRCPTCACREEFVSSIA